MKAICTNGLVIECGNFKAIDGGVILTEDVKRKRPIGFVPTATLRYVLPDEVAADAEGTEKASDVGTTIEGVHEQPRSSETDVPSPAQRRTITRLRDRLDRIEATIESSQGEDTAGSSRAANESTSDARAPADGTDADAESDVLRVTGGDGSNGSNGDVEGADSTADERETGTDTGHEETIARDEREGADDAYPDLQRVDGLGPTYAGRLYDDGIETLADLEAADAEAIAAVADVGTSRAEDWVAQAGELA